MPAHGYAQNLLWCDPFERFCVVSFVWAPSARTPVHDHQMWGLVGMLRDAGVLKVHIHDPAAERELDALQGARAELGEFALHRQQHADPGTLTDAVRREAIRRRFDHLGDRWQGHLLEVGSIGHQIGRAHV